MGRVVERLGQAPWCSLRRHGRKDEPGTERRKDFRVSSLARALFDIVARGSLWSVVQPARVGDQDDLAALFWDVSYCPLQSKLPHLHHENVDIKYTRKSTIQQIRQTSLNTIKS